MLRFVFGCAFLVALVSCAPAPSSAAEQARVIEGQVWSPYCPGRLLIDCTTEQARELRASIQHRLDRGDRPNEVLEWIRQNHGDEALARPPGGRSGLAVWLIPGALFVAGAILVGALVRRWTRKRTAPVSPAMPPTRDSLARIHEEVQEDL